MLNAKIISFFEKNIVFIVFSLIGLFLTMRSYFLIYPDLNLFYPFTGTDSFDWIANGLYYSGKSEVFFSFRPPAIPLLVAFLEKINILNWLPAINQAILFFFYFFIYKTLRLFFTKTTALLTVILLFFNFFLHNYSLYLLADLYATLFIFAGYYYYLKSKYNPKNYIWASFLWTVSFFIQYAFVFVLPAIIINFLLKRKKDILNKKLIVAAIIPIVSIITFFLFKKLIFGDFLYSSVTHVGLINFHLDGIFFYLTHLV